MSVALMLIRPGLSSYRSLILGVSRVSLTFTDGDIVIWQVVTLTPTHRKRSHPYGLPINIAMPSLGQEKGILACNKSPRWRVRSHERRSGKRCMRQ